MTPGFRIKLHSAFTSPMMIGGVPRQFAIILWTFCAAFVLGLQVWYIFPLFLLIHWIVAWIIKKDPYLMAILSRHLKQKAYYDV
ncbi:MAG TPA: ABC transporter substrate-binding protein [Coxiellaceae bacterium]|nr:ABC transporter substrate-binding protein [Coxiellaceae bacterium]